MLSEKLNPLEYDMTRSVKLDYTNWNGERRFRFIIPKSIHYKSTDHHGRPQWLLLAYDLEKREDRYFAFSGIHDWKNN